jgi:glycosyltransferase involved in cell wall biosynthesis
MAEAVAEEVPWARVVRLAMPVETVDVRPAEVAALRQRLGVAPGDLLVGSFGLLTREKRLETLARAVARAAVSEPRLRLLLVGPVPDPAALDALLERRGVAARTIVTGRVPLAELPLHMAAADLVAHLRYPTARESSAALLRVLAQGRPAVIPDLENLAEIPAGAAVKVDVADEEGELTRALLRLASRPELRARLGAQAQEFVRREHAPRRCLDSYEEALRAAAHAPDPPPRPWPAHWLRYSQTSRNP